MTFEVIFPRLVLCSMPSRTFSSLGLIRGFIVAYFVLSSNLFSSLTPCRFLNERPISVLYALFALVRSTLLVLWKSQLSWHSKLLTRLLSISVNNRWRAFCEALREAETSSSVVSWSIVRAQCTASDSSSTIPPF